MTVWHEDTETDLLVIPQTEKTALILARLFLFLGKLLKSELETNWLVMTDVEVICFLGSVKIKTYFGSKENREWTVDLHF